MSYRIASYPEWADRLLFIVAVVLFRPEWHRFSSTSKMGTQMHPFDVIPRLFLLRSNCTLVTCMIECMPASTCMSVHFCLSLAFNFRLYIPFAKDNFLWKKWALFMLHKIENFIFHYAADVATKTAQLKKNSGQKSNPKYIAHVTNKLRIACYRNRVCARKKKAYNVGNHDV